MKLLLDTHALLWFIEGDSNLSHKAKEQIEDINNEVFVSVISLFEISVKLKLEKLPLQKPLSAIFQDITDAYIVILPVSNSHLLQYQNIHIHPDHRDPLIVSSSPQRLQKTPI